MGFVSILPVLPVCVEWSQNPWHIWLCHGLNEKNFLAFIDLDFCVGFNDENIGCVKFGLITDDTDLEELIGLVYSVGKEIEESSKVSQSNISTLLSFL